MKVMPKTATPNRSKYSAFTLIEMLIVMSIFIILAAFSTSSFAGLRDSILVNENSQELKQNIRYTQRSAMLLTREPSQKWLYGIGMDFSNISVDGTYRIFQYCSPYDEFGGARSVSKIPGYDPETSTTVSIINGYFPTPLLYVADCDKDTNISQAKIVQVTGVGPTNIDAPLMVGVPKSGGQPAPLIVLFESITGSVFLYDSGGMLLNYNLSEGTRSRTGVVDLEIAIATPDMVKATLIKVEQDSGKVSNRPLGAGEIGNYNYVRVER